MKWKKDNQEKKDIKLEVDNHCFSTIPDGGKSNVFSNHEFASLVKITFKSRLL